MTPFVCRHCGAELAQTDGRTLVLGGACVDRSVVLWCERCKGRTQWREAPQPHPPPPKRPCCQPRAS